MEKLRTSGILKLFSKRGTYIPYIYNSGNTQISLTEINNPEGPIRFKRWKEDDDENKANTGGNDQRWC